MFVCASIFRAFCKGPREESKKEGSAGRQKHPTSFQWETNHQIRGQSELFFGLAPVGRSSTPKCHPDRRIPLFGLSPGGGGGGGGLDSLDRDLETFTSFYIPHFHFFFFLLQVSFQIPEFCFTLFIELGYPSISVTITTSSSISIVGLGHSLNSLSFRRSRTWNEWAKGAWSRCAPRCRRNGTGFGAKELVLVLLKIQSILLNICFCLFQKTRCGSLGWKRPFWSGMLFFSIFDIFCKNKGEWFELHSLETSCRLLTNLCAWGSVVKFTQKHIF